MAGLWKRIVCRDLTGYFYASIQFRYESGYEVLVIDSGPCRTRAEAEKGLARKMGKLAFGPLGCEMAKLAFGPRCGRTNCSR
jgi:hypothetical protein